MGLTIEPMTACIGALVSGIDLATAGPEDQVVLHDAWLKHKVLFFRDQDLTPAEHVRFAALWGELEVH